VAPYVAGKTKAASSAGAVPVFVAYNIPFRDCAQYSAGGASTNAAYRTWIRGVAKGLFRPGLDPVQIYVTIAALSRFHLANGYSLSVTLDTDMTTAEWRKARQAHALAVLEGYLTMGRETLR